MIEEITITEEVVSISLFEDNKTIKKIKAPNLKKIENRAFYNCVNLVEIIAPKLEYIGEYAFYGTSLKNFDFSNIMEIGKNAFECSKIEKICLPKELKKIGKYAFANNPYLVSVEFLTLMTKIKDGMFENCVNLKEVIFSNTINKLGIGVFRNCKKLDNVKLPEHLKVIESNAFWGCKNLKKLIINKELEVVNDYAFGDTKLTDFSFPGKIKTIGKLPFYMCYQLKLLNVSKQFHDDILDKTNSKLEELVIGKNKVKILKQIKKVFNYNNLLVVRYADNSFQVVSKPIRYYDDKYLIKLFPNFDIKLLMRYEEIMNIFYWESILKPQELKEINPLAIIALPPNINVIKAFFNNHSLYDKIIYDKNVSNYDKIIALIKFITIFGGLSKKNSHDIPMLIDKIGLQNLTRQFLGTEVSEYNHKFTDIYLRLLESNNQIGEFMPFLYNNIGKVINSKDNTLLDTFAEASDGFDAKIVRSADSTPNYEWLDSTSTVNLLWVYILASASEHSIESSEEERKVVTYYIKDDKGMIIASSNAYYSSAEKYLLFKSIVLSQSFINKGYDYEKMKSLIADSVLKSIENIINFLNEINPIITKVHISLSEKNLKEQIKNRGTKIIVQKF